ncbi:hypothetical protein BJ741DRAFT_599516 [Chytriomyces cf. hyalinus JEL632]|nr:hypothetical protein BJ741DRAFT_599516 [Chytriomyces cf. hyalinus JEL632]
MLVGAKTNTPVANASTLVDALQTELKTTKTALLRCKLEVSARTRECESLREKIALIESVHDANEDTELEPRDLPAALVLVRTLRTQMAIERKQMADMIQLLDEIEHASTQLDKNANTHPAKRKRRKKNSECSSHSISRSASCETLDIPITAPATVDDRTRPQLPNPNPAKPTLNSVSKMVEEDIIELNRANAIPIPRAGSEMHPPQRLPPNSIGLLNRPTLFQHTTRWLQPEQQPAQSALFNKSSQGQLNQPSEFKQVNGAMNGAKPSISNDDHRLPTAHISNAERGAKQRQSKNDETAVNILSKVVDPWKRANEAVTAKSHQTPQSIPSRSSQASDHFPSDMKNLQISQFALADSMCTVPALPPPRVLVKETTELKATGGLVIINTDNPDGKRLCRIGTLAVKATDGRQGTGRLVMYDDVTDEKVLNMVLDSSVKVVSSDETNVRICVKSLTQRDVYLLQTKSVEVATKIAAKIRMLLL